MKLKEYLRTPSRERPKTAKRNSVSIQLFSNNIALEAYENPGSLHATWSIQTTLLILQSLSLTEHFCFKKQIWLLSSEVILSFGLSASYFKNEYMPIMPTFLFHKLYSAERPNECYHFQPTSFLNTFKLLSPYLSLVSSWCPAFYFDLAFN